MTTVEALRTFAMRYPEAREGIACEGTALEKRTIKARDKAFLFLGVTDAMMKLGNSLSDARARAAKAPDRYKAGATGWVTVKFGSDGSPPLSLLERWIDESYRLVANKGLVAALSGGTKPAAKKSPAKKKRRA